VFADLYHAHHSLNSEDIPFWTGLAMRHSGPILELGCGTGRVLRPLAETVARDSSRLVLGIERDPAMLTVLRRNLPPELAGRVRLIQADFTQFCLAVRFELVVMPCNTYSTLSADQRRQTLERVRAHLLPGGVFAAALPNPEMLRSLPARSAPEVEEVLPHPVDGEPVQVSSGWRRTRQAFTLTWHYDHLLPDGGVERVSAQVSHGLSPVGRYMDELRAAGFEEIKLYGDYEGVMYEEESENLIFVAR
jgi:SAM-dependent methyltransferase